MFKFDKKQWEYWLRGIKLKNNSKVPREIFDFSKSAWGHNFVITSEPPIEVDNEYKGYGFDLFKNNGNTKLKVGDIITTTCPFGLNRVIVNFLITELKEPYDPRDMFFWKGVRLRMEDLSEEEHKIISKIHNSYSK